MSLYEKEFSMEYTIKNASKFSDGENQWSDKMIWRNLIWRLKISKLNGFLGVFLYCSQTSNTWIKDCQISAIVRCEIVSDNEKTHSDFQDFDMEPPTKMEGPMVDFQKFLKWDEMEKNFLIADSAKILVCMCYFKTTWYGSVLSGKMKILHTFKCLARFEEYEAQFSDSRECIGISWRICIKKEDQYFGCYLQCESNLNTSQIRNGNAIFKLRIQSKENYEVFDLGKLEFKRPTMMGNSKLMKWEDLILNYLVNDSVTIEADLEAYCGNHFYDNFPAKNFVLSQQFSDMSLIEEGESKFSRFEKRFTIPWRIELRRVSGFLEIYLHCGAEIEKLGGACTLTKTDCYPTMNTGRYKSRFN